MYGNGSFLVGPSQVSGNKISGYMNKGLGNEVPTSELLGSVALICAPSPIRTNGGAGGFENWNISAIVTKSRKSRNTVCRSDKACHVFQVPQISHWKDLG